MSEPTTIFGCEDWKAVAGPYTCCVGCHNDEADGYPSFTWRNHDGRYYEVCCTAPLGPVGTT